MYTQNSATADSLILERLPKVKARTGLSRTEIYRRIAAGTFPSQIKLGAHASAWDSREVDRWINERIASAKSVEL